MPAQNDADTATEQIGEQIAQAGIAPRHQAQLKHLDCERRDADNEQRADPGKPLESETKTQRYEKDGVEGDIHQPQLAADQAPDAGTGGNIDLIVGRVEGYQEDEGPPGDRQDEPGSSLSS